MKKKLFLVIALALVMVLALSAVAMAAGFVINVSVTGLSMPEEGQSLDFSVSTSSNVKDATVTWYDHTVGGSPLTSSSTVIPGHTYWYIVRVTPAKSDFVFQCASNHSGNWYFYYNNASINGKSCTTNTNPGPYAVVYSSDGLYGTTLDIHGYYTVPTTTEIDYVSITAVDSVTVGQKLGKTFKASSSNYSLDRYEWISKSVNDYNNDSINSDTIAEAGEEYAYKLYIKPKAGYKFPGVDSGYPNQRFDGTLIVNGTEEKGWIDYKTGYLYYNSDWLDAEEPEDIDNVALTVTEPKAGAKPATSFKVVNKTNDVALSQKDIVWYEYDEIHETWKYISTEVFVEGVQYQVLMVVYPESGYFAGHPSSGFAKYTGTYTVNGNTPSTYDKNESVAYAEGKNTYSHCLVAYYTFAAGPTITKQPVSVTAEPGGDAVFTVEASGENLKYQWYGGTDASPTPLDGNANTLTLTNLTLNNSGTDFWCVVSNDAGSVTSNKATLTVSDSYVFPFTDVPSWQWYYEDVKNANKLKLIDGKTPTLFKPDDNMTYAEAIKLAACMNQVYNTGTVTLKNGSPWYQSYVDYAKTHGIPWNYSDYNAKITRKDYVYIFYAALPASDYTAINNIGLAKIPDVGPSTFASTEILAFYNAGILTGYSDGSFAPDDNIKRSEVAAILSRMMDHNARIKFSL